MSCIPQGVRNVIWRVQRCGYTSTLAWHVATAARNKHKYKLEWNCKRFCVVNVFLVQCCTTPATRERLRARQQEKRQLSSKNPTHKYSPHNDSCSVWSECSARRLLTWVALWNCFLSPATDMFATRWSCGRRGGALVANGAGGCCGVPWLTSVYAGVHPRDLLWGKRLTTKALLRLLDVTGTWLNRGDVAASSL